MKVIFNPKDGSEPYEKKLSVGTIPEVFLRGVIDGFYEIPELTEHFKKVFESEAKEQEYKNMIHY